MSEHKMNPEWKAKWIEALRSGKYKQGKGYLEHSGEYCCLGVLCAVVDPDFKKCYAKRAGLNTCELPKHIVNLVGFPTSENYSFASLPCLEKSYKPSADLFATKDTLDGLNDVGADFNTIADIIEKEY